ncbi:MAG: hypothetical protein ACOCG6_04775 [Candidatus Cloacimonadaceae bacterium]
MFKVYKVNKRRSRFRNILIAASVIKFGEYSKEDFAINQNKGV